ncbi:MAG: hypothetical protein QOH35_561, partial [Acidobacteriaceae bacterium]|nr:hypothetical protein [Acidobacteriaceae bacterium]
MGGLTAHAPPTWLEDLATGYVVDFRCDRLISGHSTSSDAIVVLIQPKGTGVPRAPLRTRCRAQRKKSADAAHR